MNEPPELIDIDEGEHFMDPTDSESNSSGDESDEGLENAAYNSDPEEIIFDRVLPYGFDIPQDLSDEEEEGENENVVEIGRRRHDRHNRSTIVSRGDDDPDRNSRQYVFRRHLRGPNMVAIRTDQLFENGFAPNLIIGMVMKHRELFYFCEGTRNRKCEMYLMESSVLKFNYPRLVIDFHQKLLITPNEYDHM